MTILAVQQQQLRDFKQDMAQLRADIERRIAMSNDATVKVTVKGSELKELFLKQASELEDKASKVESGKEKIADVLNSLGSGNSSSTRSAVMNYGGSDAVDNLKEVAKQLRADAKRNRWLGEHINATEVFNIPVELFYSGSFLASIITG